MQNKSASLNPMQLEILQLFSREMSTEDMQAIKRLITRYFAQKAISATNQVWDEKGWNEEDAQKMLQMHERTPYKNGND
jgi:hypothetical protein